jgi:DNA-binding NtrC family response regulator/pSer/pThr/pTyr-binding forkhead associated (FHA) protein
MANDRYPLLRVESGPFAGREITLQGNITIGRGEDCELRLVDEKVSRKHACVDFKDGAAALRDLGSINGTVVKGRRVSVMPLADGDRFRVGQSEIVFVSNPETDKKTQVASPASGSGASAASVKGGPVVFAAAATTPIAPAVKAEGSNPAAVGVGKSTPLTGATAVAIAKPKKRRTLVESVLHSASADIFSGAPTAEDVSSVYRLARHLTGHLEEKKLARMWLADVISELHADTGALLITGAGEDFLCVWPETSSAPEISRTVTERILSTGDALLAADLEDDGLAGSESLAGQRVATLVAAPLPIQAGHAIVCLDRRGKDKSPFVERDLALLVEAAKDAGAAMDAARFHAAHLERLEHLNDSADIRGKMIGKAPKFLAAIEIALKAAPFTSSVLIGGPTGTGKELVARLIHDESPRARKHFVAVNCAAIPESLQESELFGHEKGAFTGAANSKEGYFKLADGGSLFLDEVGDLAPSTQVKLLRVLESGEFYPVGSTKVVRVNVRLISATNRDMPLEIGTGRFREDLFHRMNVVRVDLPSLRERTGDIRALAMHFLQKKSAELKRPIHDISEKAMAALERYAWPGNIRELCNVIERAIVLTSGHSLDVEDLPLDIATPGTRKTGGSAPEEGPISLAEAERRAIVAALKHTQWQKTRAAEVLGVSWPTLQKKIQEYGLKPD